MANKNDVIKNESAQVETDSPNTHANYNQQPNKTQVQSKPVQLYFTQMFIWRIPKEEHHE